MSNKSSSVRFTLNFANNTIVGTKASFDKAGKGYGPIYEELAEKLAKHPTFTCVVKVPKQPAKPKRTYKGMDIPFIVDFLTAIGDSSTLQMVNDVVAFADKQNASKYPSVKRVLFDEYPNFDYADAKHKVSDYRHKRMLEDAKAQSVVVPTTTTDEVEEADLSTAVGF